MKKLTILTALLLTGSIAFGQYDWDAVDIPADAEGGTWQLQTNASDDFNYVFNATSTLTDFGDSDKWYNFYHDLGWNGPGATYWQYDHVSVNGQELAFKASRNPSTSKMGVPGFNLGCITSNNKVSYPVFVEAKISVANLALASDVWMLSPDNTQEIDILECYGSADNNNAWGAQKIHLSHHSNPSSADYQPRDEETWYYKHGVEDWGAFCANEGGERQYVRVGVYWKSPFHFEYYVDGELVRVMYHNAYAAKISGSWKYHAPQVDADCKLIIENGYQQTTFNGSSIGDLDYDRLKNVSDASPINYIDPYMYQGESGFTKELDIIINMEAQDWKVDLGIIPTDTELDDSTKNNNMLIDWIRVYNRIGGTPIENGINEGCKVTASINEFVGSGLSVYPNPFSDVISINASKQLKEVVLYQVNGALVKQLTVDGSEITIETDELSKGVYVLKTLSQDNQWSTIKLVK